MSQVFYDNQKPIYRNTAGTTSVTLDNENNQIIITDTTIPKTIIIDSQQFSNGVQTLPYVQMYENINAVEACVFPPVSTSILAVNNEVRVQDLSGNVGRFRTNGTDTEILSSGNLILDPSGTLITAKNRVIQQLGLDPSYNAVNGYYGLSKDAYPSLNPSSAGVKATSTWDYRTINKTGGNQNSVCWSPELGIFVSVGLPTPTITTNFSTTGITYSYDGINWTSANTGITLTNCSRVERLLLATAPLDYLLVLVLVF